MAREIALRALTSKARTRQELADVLARKRVPVEVADQVLSRFTEVGLLDDQAYATAWLQGQRRRLRSRRVLAQELRAKGVEADVIDGTLAEVDPGLDLEVARALAAKKVGSLRSLDRQVAYRRLSGVLARRGFSSAVISTVVRDALAAHPSGEFEDDDPAADVDSA